MHIQYEYDDHGNVKWKIIASIVSVYVNVMVVVQVSIWTVTLNLRTLFDALYIY